MKKVYDSFGVEVTEIWRREGNEYDIGTLSVVEAPTGAIGLRYLDEDDRCVHEVWVPTELWGSVVGAVNVHRWLQDARGQLTRLAAEVERRTSEAADRASAAAVPEPKQGM